MEGDWALMGPTRTVGGRPCWARLLSYHRPSWELYTLATFSTWIPAVCKRQGSGFVFGGLTGPPEAYLPW